MNPNDKPPPRDYRKEVTDDTIRMLEEGAAPWQRAWETGEAGRIPYNPTTHKPYRGGNVIALMVAGMRKGYTDPRWMTYRQAAEKGRAGAQGREGVACRVLGSEAGKQGGGTQAYAECLLRN